MRLSLALLAALALSSLIQSIFAQTVSPATGACGELPCPTATCGSGPCPQSGGQGSISNGGKRYTPPPAKTEEQKEKIEKQGRYDDLFSQLEAQERLAKSYEDAGDAPNAASWRADFARKSGLTPEEAGIVKKIALNYRKESAALMEQRAALINLGTNPSQLTANRLQASAIQKQILDLFAKAMSDLLVALGSESFTRLDAYTRHMHDNDRVFYGTPDKAIRGSK